MPDYGEYASTDWPDPEKGKAAMISRMDADIGRLLALLKELKIDDNTLVMFSSDNGPPANEGGRLPEFNDSNGPLRGYQGRSVRRRHSRAVHCALAGPCRRERRVTRRLLSPT